jgi:hypothetical protein
MELIFPDDNESVTGWIDRLNAGLQWPLSDLMPGNFSFFSQIDNPENTIKIVNDAKISTGRIALYRLERSKRKKPGTNTIPANRIAILLCVLINLLCMLATHLC